jgi:DNA-directed RNA polymerase subunit RPC12/RpoP
VPVAKCYRCGAETRMYDDNVPVCPACAEALKAKAKLGLNETL